MYITFLLSAINSEVALNKLFSTWAQRQEKRKSPWQQIIVVLSGRAMLESVLCLFESGFFYMGMPDRFVSLWLQCIIQREGKSKGGLQMPHSAPLSQQDQRSAGESNWHPVHNTEEDRQKTMQVKFRCLLPLSVLVRLHKRLLWEPFWQQKPKPFVMHTGLAVEAANKASKIWSFQIANQPD